MIPKQAIRNNFSNNQPQWFLNMILDYKKGFKMIFGARDYPQKVF